MECVFSLSGSSGEAASWQAGFLGSIGGDGEESQECILGGTLVKGGSLSLGRKLNWRGCGGSCQVVRQSWLQALPPRGESSGQRQPVGGPHPPPPPQKAMTKGDDSKLGRPKAHSGRLSAYLSPLWKDNHPWNWWNI